MARDFNQNRNTNAKLGIETIDKYGKTFAVQYGLDGFSAVNNVVQQMPNSIIPYLEGNIAIKQYAVPINVDELCNYALASFPNIEELTLFSLDIVSVEDHLSYLSKLKIMYVNQNNLSGYSWFSTTIHSGYESFTSVDDYIGYVVVYNTLPYIVTENNKNDLEIVVGTTIAYDKYLTNITVDYTYVVEDYTQDHVLTSEIINEQLNALTNQKRNAITKLVIDNTYTSASVYNVLWSYNFSTLLPYLNNNIWYNGRKFDFSEFTIQDNTEDHILTASVVETELAKIGVDKYTAIEKIIVPVDFTSYASGSITELQAFMNTNSIDKLVTTYEAGTMELSLSGDIVAKITSINKTLDEALVYTRPFDDTKLNNDSNTIIIPPYLYNGTSNKYGSNVCYIANLKLNNNTIYFVNSTVQPVEINLTVMKNFTTLVSYYGALFFINDNVTYTTKRLNIKFEQGSKNAGTLWLFGGYYNSILLEECTLTGCTSNFMFGGRSDWQQAKTTSMNENAFIKLFNSLGTPSETKTIKLTATDLAKLTNADIQLAYDKNWSLSPTPSAFTFTIGNNTYSCDFGMTWTTWVASAYNTIGATITDNKVYIGSDTIKLDNVDVVDTDMIRYGNEYSVGE